MSDLPYLSIVVPAYNEARRLPPTMAALAEFLRSFTQGYEVLVVVEGSTDGTLEIAAGLAAQQAHFQVIDNGPQRGKGHAVRSGMQRARGEIVFSDFLKKVETGEVREVTLKGNNVSGRLSDGSSFRTFTADYPDLVKSLKDRGVKIDVKPPETNSWLAIVLQWVPMLLFIETFRVPVVILPIVNHDNAQHAPDENLRLLRIGARQVITTGHAYNIRDLRLPGSLAGKTGTAEFGLPDANGVLPFHSWFVAFLPSAPGATDSPIAVITFTYHATVIGNVSTEVVKYFLQQYFHTSQDLRLDPVTLRQLVGGN